MRVRESAGVRSERLREAALLGRDDAGSGWDVGTRSAVRLRCADMI